jgi:septal ring factor EnvC (AmiA/AmiB activator)
MTQINQDITNKIKTWVSYELKNQELKTQLNQISEAKDQLSKEILQFINVNNMKKTAINVGNNRICYYDEMQYNSLSFIFLKECLMLYFNNDENKVNQICDFIKSNRKRISKPNLKFLPRKNK